MTCFFIVYHHGGRISAGRENGRGNALKLIFPMNPQVKTASIEERDFISKILLNETMWEKLIAGN